MELMPQFGFFRMIGTFSFAIIFIVWAIQIINAGFYYHKTGDSFPLLDATGGRLFILEKSLVDNVNLLSQKDILKEKFPDFFSDQLVYLLKRTILLDLAIYFIVVYALFKIALWLGGEKQWSPLYQFIVISLIFVVFATIQVAYTFYISGQVVYPLQGVYGAIKHADLIFQIDAPELRIISSNLTDIRKQAGLALNVTNVSVETQSLKLG